MVWQEPEELTVQVDNLKEHLNITTENDENFKAIKVKYKDVTSSIRYLDRLKIDFLSDSNWVYSSNFIEKNKSFSVNI